MWLYKRRNYNSDRKLEDGSITDRIDYIITKGVRSIKCCGTTRKIISTYVCYDMIMYHT